MSVNGIPQAFAPNNLAQRLANLERKLEERTSARTYVNLANVTVSEGGTIDSNVGDKLTETVKDKIVIDGGNLGEGALDGKRMVGAIIETNATANRGVKIDDNGLRGYDADGEQYIRADETGLSLRGELEVQGETLEDTPRTMLTRVGNVQRTYAGEEVSAPGLIFTTDEDVLESAPGVYSPNGRMLRLQGEDFLGMYHIDISPDSVDVVNPRVTIGRFNLAAQITQSVSIVGSTVSIGYKAVTPYGDRDSVVDLLGNVKVNGDRVMKTVTPNIPAGEQPIELIANGSATTSSTGTFTIAFPAGTFPTACTAIFIVPNSGGGIIPVVNGTGALTKTSCQAVQPGNGNKAITYSYRAIGY